MRHEDGHYAAFLISFLAQREAPDTPQVVTAKIVRESHALIAGFGLSVPLFFVTQYAWVRWLLLPLATRRLRRIEFGRQRRQPPRPASPSAGG